MTRTVGPAFAVGGACIALYLSLPPNSVAQLVAFTGVFVAVMLLLLVRLHREGLLRRPPWVFLALSVTLYVGATPFWGLVPVVTGRDLSFPSPLDGVYFLAYGFAAAFLVGVLRHRYRATVDATRGAVVALLDAGLFSVAGVALVSPLLLGPNLRDPDVAGVVLLVTVGYQLLTALLVGLTARLLISGRGPTLARWLLLIWAGGELAGDVLYGYLAAGGEFHYGHPIAVTWLLSYTALGAFALQPSLGQLTAAQRDLPLEGWRVWVPLASALVPLAVAVTTPRPLLAVLAGIGVVLLMTRLYLMSGDLAEQRRLSRELTVLNERLEHLAAHDPLTGAANRAHFARLLDAAWAGHWWEGRQLAVLGLDLDDFKAVNDQHGHQVGDQVLVAVTERLRRCVRDHDTLARLGGDEFALLLPDTPLEHAEVVAKRILARLAEPVVLAGVAHTVDASIGVAVATTDQAHPSGLLRAADDAMYTAKAAGPGRFHVYGGRSSTHDAAGGDAPVGAPRTSEAREPRDRAEPPTIADLEHLLDTEGIAVAYQPVVSLETGCIVGVEALARWDHHAGGAVSPTTFIPLAELGGLASKLGAQVLDLACRQLAAWERAQPRARRWHVAVNLSAAQLADPGLVGSVEAALGAAGLGCDRLVLEVTETVLGDDPAAMFALLADLRRRGVRLAIDDFGTGYSSLARLVELQFDQLKVDRMFVQRIEQPEQPTPVLDAVLHMSRRLGLDVVAEGIETPAQLAGVLARGCGYAQGFLFSRPLAAEEFGLLAADEPWDIDELAMWSATPHRSRLQQLLNWVAVGGSPAPGEELDRVLHGLAELTGLESVYLTQIDLRAQVQRVVAAANTGEPHVPVDLQVPWCDTLCRRALTEGLEVIIEPGDGVAAAAFTGGNAPVTYVGLPVLGDEGELLGTLCGVVIGIATLPDEAIDTLRWAARLLTDPVGDARRRDPGPRLGRAPTPGSTSGSHDGREPRR